jgi:hypothetical protein
MQVVIVYESMYGNTRLIADAIGAGISPAADVIVVPVADAGPEMLHGADLIVVGAPTHVHGMSRARTRQAAAEAAQKPGSGLALEPAALGPGVRDWLASVGDHRTRAAAFDTRMHGPAALTGRSSKDIARELRRHGFDLIQKPESFFVTKDNNLDASEEARARAWGAQLFAVLAASTDTAARWHGAAPGDAEGVVL